MSKYLKHFETTSEYESYIGGGAVLPNVSYTEDTLKVYYNPIQHDYSQDYFTMVVTVGGDVTWAGTGNNALYYSKDNGTTWSEPSVNIILSVNEGDKVLWKGGTSPIDEEGIGVFNGSTDVRYTVEGNVMSLLFGDVFKGQTSLEDKNYVFNNLFYNNKGLTSAENLSLPATTLADDCYYAMFYGCINLVYAPKVLPATTLAFECYCYMFRNCTSLVTTPELPAPTLTYNCYSEMFEGCTSLVTTPELPATTLTDGCYQQMFSGCTKLNHIKCLATNISASSCLWNWVKNVASTGTFVKASSMASWPTGTSGIPSGWTVVDA